MKIYTRTGDSGTTALVGGKRVSKNHPRVEAYGAVDELMAHVAYLRDNMEGDNLQDYINDLLRILNELMNVSAILATEDDQLLNPNLIPTDGIKYLEERMDYIQPGLQPIDKFTLPGGHPLVSLSHIARTVCRRAEREAIKIESDSEAQTVALQYLNRLSDYFYTLGRIISQEFNVEEEFWLPND